MIVLLTDFGESEYVGVMKGVIYNLVSGATITDLTHSISPQSVCEAAWVLLKSYRFFPKHTIFTCVVDPGVGTTRDAVLVETPDYVFISPDNGLLSPTLDKCGQFKIYSLKISSAASHTFHGRDVFAVAAGKYELGVDPKELGSLKKDLEVSFSFYLEGRTGQIVRIDRFGNIITNLPPMQSKLLRVEHGSTSLQLPFVDTYANGPSEGLFLVVGSYGTLEIAAQNNSATELLPVAVGGRITIVSV